MHQTKNNNNENINIKTERIRILFNLLIKNSFIMFGD